jgi:hypothetical protein
MVAKMKNTSTTKTKVKAVNCSTPSTTMNHKEFLMQCANYIARKIVDAKPAEGQTPHSVAE